MAAIPPDSKQDRENPQKRLPPSPQINVRQLVRDPLAFFTTLAQEYSDVVCYRPTPEPAYLVSRPDFIRHVLVDNNRNYSKSTYINQMFKSAVADGLLTAEGDEWRQQRRLMQPAFHATRLSKLDGLITTAVSRMLEKWEANRLNGQTIDIAGEMSALTLTITTQALFGVDIGEEANRVGDIIFAGGDLLAKPRNSRFQNALKAIEEVVYRIIDERRRSSLEGDDLLSMLMQTRDEETGAMLDDRQLRDQVLSLLLAGFETTSNALTWTWYLLALHPEMAERLHDEAVEVLGERLPDSQDLPRLSYTRMVFEEALRLYPSAWILGRRALGDDQLGEYFIPANSVVAISPYAVHRLSAYWEHPDLFDPERFSPARSITRHKFAYLPFGAGPRQCIGNNFAMLEAHLDYFHDCEEIYISFGSGTNDPT